MNVIVLGGTEFLGRVLVERALAAGHDVTLFNRGRSNPELFPEARKLRGDRKHDLGALADGSWDSVVDLTGYEPEHVRAVVELVAARAPHYLFVSSISAYRDFSQPPTEGSPLADDDEYGGKKARCEAEVRRVYGDAALVVRPGLIVGPYDPTGRFTYWPHRLARGGEVLAPGSPERRVQFVDVRDLAEWMLGLVERREAGAFTAANDATMGDVLDACRRAAGTDAELVWVDDAFLLERGVGEWMELPLWIASPEYAGMLAADTTRARESGLGSRPLEDTARATLELARPTGDAGLAPDRECELIAAWRALHDARAGAQE